MTIRGIEELGYAICSYSRKDELNQSKFETDTSNKINGENEHRAIQHEISSSSSRDHPASA